MFPVKNLLCNQCLIGMKRTKDKIDPDYQSPRIAYGSCDQGAYIII
jgi:hypothetical protein